jgi:hypothetical protein
VSLAKAAMDLERLAREHSGGHVAAATDKAKLVASAILNLLSSTAPPRKGRRIKALDDPNRPRNRQPGE